MGEILLCLLAGTGLHGLLYGMLFSFCFYVRERSGIKSIKCINLSVRHLNDRVLHVSLLELTLM